MEDNKNREVAPEEEMKVELELEDGTVAMCEVITILEVQGKEYIALLPDGQDENSDEQDVWFYRYSENPENPNEEPELVYIDDDDEYEMVCDAFDEFLDECEYDEE